MNCVECVLVRAVAEFAELHGAKKRKLQTPITWCPQLTVKLFAGKTRETKWGKQETMSFLTTLKLCKTQHVYSNDGICSNAVQITHSLVRGHAVDMTSAMVFWIFTPYPAQTFGTNL